MIGQSSLAQCHSVHLHRTEPLAEINLNMRTLIRSESSHPRKSNCQSEENIGKASVHYRRLAKYRYRPSAATPQDESLDRSSLLPLQFPFQQLFPLSAKFPKRMAGAFFPERFAVFASPHCGVQLRHDGFVVLMSNPIQEIRRHAISSIVSQLKAPPLLHPDQISTVAPRFIKK